MSTFLNASFSGTTMTVSSMGPATLGGDPGQIWVGMPLKTNDGNGTFVTCTVTADASTDGTLTGTGLTGTYRVSVSQTVGGTVALKSGLITTTTGPYNTNTSFAAAMLRQWNSLISVFSPVMKYIMLCPMNEWSGTLGGTAWRDFWTGTTNGSGVPALRTAGWTCPLSIDAPGSGQDGGTGATIVRDGPAIVATDSFKSLIFSPHFYSNLYPGELAATTGPSLANFRDTYGAAVIIEEFGQGQKNFDVNGATTALEIMGTCEALGFGWFPWVYDQSFQQPNGSTTVDNTKYSLVYDYSHGYETSNSADLTLFGKVVVLDPVCGLQAIAQKATAGSFS
jgi:hypothetical protein